MASCGDCKTEHGDYAVFLTEREMTLPVTGKTGPHVVSSYTVTYVY